MKNKIRYFILYAKEFGFGNAIIFTLFKVFPRLFVLMHQKVNAGTNNVWPEMATVDPIMSLNAVLDYKSWSEYGGAAKPVPSKDTRTTFIWFVPDWSNVWGGGHYTLFRFANHFAKFNTRNIIYIYNNERHTNPNQLQNELIDALPDCKLEVIIDPALLPACTGAIATTWQSAYDVRAFEFAQKKFYFMQDYESQFYAYGTASMQANATYGFGFIGITGGGWLKQCYESHGGSATNYLFAADRKIFYPSNKNGVVRNNVKKLFFYGRPSTERRCFDLGMASLLKISQHYPDVEIIIAGLDLKAKPPFPATLLGNMSLKDTGDLYRTCDIGMAFSGTNLSYLPVELMASGVPVISNNGPQVEWHCKHGVNAYLADPTPVAMLEAFTELYKDQELRQKLADGGLAVMEPLTWESQMTRIYEYVSNNLPK
ncbi:glycosyltransferase [Yersinia mollaretii]|uniref:Glycosyl transferases group 1 n=1 Tax=Yersinia mollaretii TaxID=33060 RepID=A0AA36PNK9_YERMO|nr:glycosyltransferase [Yersinia mollaretii]MDA5526648.1 glycosyltransferase [Yersinia mollaretii]MDR7873439.1 glycosyltransferase [Yersinia mollaretii]PHZ32279.1 glycosyl transferase family 1 [Yersinia mollaretii]WQC76685.1 glycosyltransferase [Yersinia mollaretii]CNE50987.1 Glycosyl transferases group 1 [Yersinia mollaretii]